MRTLGPDALADQVLGLDGPYRVEDIMAAAGLAAELVRRLNRATFRTADVYTVDGVTASLERLVSGLPQLFDQLARHVCAAASDPLLACDDGRSAAVVARDAGSALGCVRLTVEDAARVLREAHTFTARLYVSDGDS